MRLPTRASYDTAVKHLYRHRLEEAIPRSLRKEIPRTNVHRWRNEAHTKYVGTELNQLAGKKLKLIRQFAADQNAQRVFWAYCRLVITVKWMLQSTDESRRLIQQKRKEVVELVERVREHVTLDKAIRFFGITKHTYDIWRRRFLIDCNLAPSRTCFRKWPMQATPHEVEKMKRMLGDPAFATWPISSVAHYARRKNIVNFSVHTWYIYNRLYDIRPKRKKKKSIKREGLRAEIPNQFWHADVTQFRTIDNVKYYIYLVVDNYSRKILSWQVSEKLSATLRLDTIEEAWKKTIGKGATDLIVDGGTENTANIVTDFINETDGGMRRIIAQQDITFSNAMVEAMNRLLKQNYLRKHHIENGDHLRKLLGGFVFDYNQVRPHDSIGGLTPSEAYAGEHLDKEKMLAAKKKARELRIMSNRRNLCRGHGSERCEG